MRFIVGITGASGAIYAQRLIDQLTAANHTVHLIATQ
ncbi:MAG: flavoprotein, partial [Verrucomicrobiia bacterium]